MKREQCRVAIAILCIVAVLLVILKIFQGESEIVEVNYIGDMERENEAELNKESTQEQEIDEKLLQLQEDEIIRVLLKDTGYQSIYHTCLEFSAVSGLTITYGDITEEIAAGESYSLTASSAALEQGCVLITPTDSENKIMISSLERGYGIPEYDGTIEVYVSNGQLVAVNELELESYLKGVLPSEMPSYFEEEALKAQAVCARSYAYMHLASYNYPEYEAHVDDSTSYQVYNNLAETEACNQAIIDTAGEKLASAGEVVTTYFFSTSCGSTTDVEAWGGEVSEENAYLTGISVSKDGTDYESDLPWYSWSITLSANEMIQVLNVNLNLQITELQSVKVTEYGTGGVALTLEICSDIGTDIVETEYDIRSALGSSVYLIQKNDGTQVEGSELLPSAFIEIEVIGNEYTIHGGGYGHGIGMSQNGANEMAKDGMDYEEILQLFYCGTELII